MKLKHITFTGIDEKTDINALQKIQSKYPIAEFGVLTSYHWYENGNRYLNPDNMVKLFDKGLNLALHVCGSAAHDCAIGDWFKVDRLTSELLHMYKRIQLNIACRKDNPAHVTPSLVHGQEIIIQQHSVKELDVIKGTAKRYGGFPSFFDKFSVLLDASGGRGIDTPIKTLKVSQSGKILKIGYAGGINPENVAEKLQYLINNVEGSFWIDMESGVRTDDWFDLDKVVKVLEICTPIIEKYQ